MWRRERLKITHPCGSWAGLSPQLLPSYPTFFFVHFCRPPLSKRRAIYAEKSPRIPDEKSGIRPQKKGVPSLNHRKSPDPEDQRHYSCFISSQLRLLCESSALLQPQTASPPAPSSTGSTTASVWLTGDGGATEADQFAHRRAAYWGNGNQRRGNVMLADMLINPHPRPESRWITSKEMKTAAKAALSHF